MGGGPVKFDPYNRGGGLENVFAMLNKNLKYR